MTGCNCVSKEVWVRVVEFCHQGIVGTRRALQLLAHPWVD